MGLNWQVKIHENPVVHPFNFTRENFISSPQITQVNAEKYQRRPACRQTGQRDLRERLFLFSARVATENPYTDSLKYL